MVCDLECNPRAGEKREENVLTSHDFMVIVCMHNTMPDKSRKCYNRSFKEEQVPWLTRRQMVCASLEVGPFQDGVEGVHLVRVPCR